MRMTDINEDLTLKHKIDNALSTCTLDYMRDLLDYITDSVFGDIIIDRVNELRTSLNSLIHAREAHLQDIHDAQYPFSQAYFATYKLCGYKRWVAVFAELYPIPDQKYEYELYFAQTYQEALDGMKSIGENSPILACSIYDLGDADRPLEEFKVGNRITGDTEGDYSN